MILEPVAHFSSPFGSKFGIPRQSGVVEELRGEIIFTDRFRNPDYIKGLEGFDHIWLIWGFSLNRGSSHPTVRPPRLGGNTTMGVFATRSPFRPNPLGLSCVRVLSIAEDGSRIQVGGGDLADGTPIFDIKPYLAYTDSHPEASCGFVGENEWEKLTVANPDGLEPELVKVLEQDPRPQYADDPERVYGMLYNGRDIHFKVDGKLITVIYEQTDKI